MFVHKCPPSVLNLFFFESLQTLWNRTALVHHFFFLSSVFSIWNNEDLPWTSFVSLLHDNDDDDDDLIKSIIFVPGELIIDEWCVFTIDDEKNEHKDFIRKLKQGLAWFNADRDEWWSRIESNWRFSPSDVAPMEDKLKKVFKTQFSIFSLLFSSRNARASTLSFVFYPCAFAGDWQRLGK